MKRKLALVHWMPLEMYPPAMNLARELAAQGWDVTVFTTRNRHGLDDFSAPGVTVSRSSSPSQDGVTPRALVYAGFHFGTARKLISDAPDAVMYFEPQSSFPVFLAGMVRPGMPVFIHHHEYHEPAEFTRPGMRLARLFHKLEQKVLFPRAQWISHTNAARLELFLADNPTGLEQRSKVLPNMPPASWGDEPNNAWKYQQAGPLRMVYVGSLSREDTYIDSCVRWIQRQPAKTVTLDIFAYNADDDTRKFLLDLNSDIIHFHPEGAKYDDLPQLLRRFHTGLILYRAETSNFRHNASNKLFEYLACGLDVVFPAPMLGVKQYERSAETPRVMQVDFDSDTTGVAMLLHRGDLPAARPEESASEALAELSAALSVAVRKSR